MHPPDSPGGEAGAARPGKRPARGSRAGLFGRRPSLGFGPPAEPRSQAAEPAAEGASPLRLEKLRGSAAAALGSGSGSGGAEWSAPAISCDGRAVGVERPLYRLVEAFALALA